MNKIDRFFYYMVATSLTVYCFMESINAVTQTSLCQIGR